LGEKKHSIVVCKDGEVFVALQYSELDTIDKIIVPPNLPSPSLGLSNLEEKICMSCF
jgi:hypothetical protein